MEWLSTNWFQLITLLGVILSWAVHYGISAARWAAMSKQVDEMESNIDSMDKRFQVHTTNSEIHVSHTLLKLFDERSEYIKSQFAEMRNDVQRIENLLTVSKQ